MPDSSGGTRSIFGTRCTDFRCFESPKLAHRVCYCADVPFFGTQSRKMKFAVLVHQTTYYHLHSSTKKLAPSKIFGTSDESGMCLRHQIPGEARSFMVMERV